MYLLPRTFLTLFAWVLYLQSTLALPSGQQEIRGSMSYANQTSIDFFDSHLELLRARQNDKPLLRIMPLGASITQGLNAGVAAVNQKGYRKFLRDQLRFWGYEVNMVGSRRNGDFSDNQHQGHPGLELDDIADAMLYTATKQKPNLVLINAGTNDCVHADERPCGLCFVQESKQRMKNMIDNIYQASEGVTIILSTLILNKIAVTDNYVKIANQGYRELVTELQAEGKKIQLAEMNNLWISLSDLSDDTHPNENGYRKMASVWASAFKKIEQKNWLTPPIEVGDSGGEACYPSPDGFSGPVQTQQGSGYGDGNYVHSSVLNRQETILYIPENNPPNPLIGEWNHFHFAQLVSRGGEENSGKPLDEFVRILDPSDRSGTLPYMSFRLNTGGGLGNGLDETWTTVEIVEQGTPECLSRGVRFADINGDGLDDFICVNQEGSLFVSLNRGGNPPNFEFIGNIRDDRFSQKNVRIADVDGDGRADFCGLEDDNGGVVCWRNGGTGDAPIAKYGGYWQGMILGGGGLTFYFGSEVEIAGVNLVDINGDGRADWVYLHPDTHSTIYINERGCKDDGSGLKPHWLKVEKPIEGWPDDPKVNTSFIMFGNVFGSGRTDVVRADYLAANPELPENKNLYYFDIHRNTGSGGTKLKGDGPKYCDMFGQGYDDYLWVWDGGMIDLFRQILSKNVNPGGEYMWVDEGRILETAVNRKYLHFGDWNGDGLCDVLAVERHTGNVQMWRNTWTGGSKPSFADPVTVVSGGLCPQLYSPSDFDLAVRFGDLDGDGRVDYLCMDPDGRTRGWLNKASGVEALSPNQIKVSVGYDRGNHRWADVNGDGLVDFLWVDKHFGNVKTWINGGIKPALDSSMFWDQQPDIWMPGVERGHNIHFPKLSTSGRADYHWVHPRLGTAYTYFNEGCDGGDINNGAPDDGQITDPNLPANPNDDDVLLCPREIKCGEWPASPNVVAFGDSYSAGIGAGQRWTDSYWDELNECFLGRGSMPNVLVSQTPGLRDKTLQFVSCTGAKVDHVTNRGGNGGRGLSQIQLYSLRADRPPPPPQPLRDFSIALMSVGGNNVGFEKVVKWCFFLRLSKCEDTMRRAERAVQPGTTEYNELFENLKASYHGVLDISENSEKFLFVTGYGRFFNDEDQSSTPDNDCNTRDMSVAVVKVGSSPWSSVPYLTRDIRMRSNNAVIALNTMIEHAVRDVAGKYPRSKFRFIDIDPYLEHRRFCDKDENGRLLEFGDAFFFIPWSSDIYDSDTGSIPIIGPRDPVTEGPGWPQDPVIDCSDPDLEEADDWYCFFQLIEAEGEYNCQLYPEACILAGQRRKLRKRTPLVDLSIKKAAFKSFHPKSYVYARVAEHIQNQWPIWQQEPDGCPCVP